MPRDLRMLQCSASAGISRHVFCCSSLSFSRFPVMVNTDNDCSYFQARFDWSLLEIRAANNDSDRPFNSSAKTKLRHEFTKGPIRSQKVASGFRGDKNTT